MAKNITRPGQVAADFRDKAIAAETLIVRTGVGTANRVEDQPTIDASSGAASIAHANGSLHLRTDGVPEVRVGGAWDAVAVVSQTPDFGSTGIKADVIAESTGAAGVTIDGLRIKDSDIEGVDVADGASTALNIDTGSATSVTGANASGLITVTTGAATAAGNNGGLSGVVTIGTGATDVTTAHTGGASGAATFKSGNTDSNHAGGTAGVSGNVIVQSGDVSATLGTGAASGTVTLESGTSTVNTGVVTVQTCASSTSAGTTGQVSIVSGNATTTGTSGAVAIGTGSATGGTTGNISLATGNDGGAGTSGNVALSTGTAAAGTTGNITIQTGTDSGAGTSGNITIAPGGHSSGTRGRVSITGVQTKAGDTAVAITGATTLTQADSGGIFSVAQTSAYDVDLPSPTDGPGLRYLFYLTSPGAFNVTLTVAGGAATFVGTIVNDVTSVLPATGSTLTFATGASALGDNIEIVSISTTLYLVRAVSSAAGGITIS